MEQSFTSLSKIETGLNTNFIISQILNPDALSDAYNQHKKLDYWNILILNKADGTVWIDMKPYAISDHCILIIKPEQSLVMKNTIMQGFLLSFTKCSTHSDDENCDSDNPARLLRFFSRSMIFFSSDSMNDIQETLCKMIKEIKSENPYRSELLKRYFKILLIYMTRHSDFESDEPWQNKNIELVEKFLMLLEKQFTEKKMVSDYATALNVSANYLNQIVKKITSESAGSHIRKRITLEAKRKAVYSNYSMKEIGYMLGFDNPSHFSKLFKKTSGINFVDFRRDLLSIPCIPELQKNLM